MKISVTIIALLLLAGCVTTKAGVKQDIIKACAIQPTIGIVNDVVGTLVAGPAGTAGAQAVNTAEATGCALLPQGSAGR